MKVGQKKQIYPNLYMFFSYDPLFTQFKFPYVTEVIEGPHFTTVVSSPNHKDIITQVRRNPALSHRKTESQTTD